MKFGVNTFIWTATFDRSNYDLLPRIKEQGFDGIEVPVFSATQFAASDIRKGVAKYGLECTVCSVFSNDMSLASEDAAVRKRTQTHLEECIQATAEAGATLLAGPLYTPLGFLPGHRRTRDEFQRAVESYQALGPVLEHHHVTLAIEPLNRFETYFLNTAEDAAALCDAVGHPRVGILFDTFHANIEEKSIPDAYRKLGRHLKHVHLCENDRGTPGTGHLDWPGVFQALRDLRYDGWLTIESFGFSIPMISAAAAIWRDIAATPESIAFEGVKFLKRNIGPPL